MAIVGLTLALLTAGAALAQTSTPTAVPPTDVTESTAELVPTRAPTFAPLGTVLPLPSSTPILTATSAPTKTVAASPSPTASPTLTASPSPSPTVTVPARGRGLGAATAAPLPPSPTSAPTASCDSAALRVWLTTQQTTIQQTAQTYDGSAGQNANDVVRAILAQLAIIENRPRPACAAEAMNWTYYLYETWIAGAVCRVQPNADCQNNVTLRAKVYLSHVESFYAPLMTASGLSDMDLATLSADDFAVGAVPTQTPTSLPTPTTPHKTAPTARTPLPPTPDAGRGNGGSGSSGGFGRGPEARAVRGAIASSILSSRVNGVLVIDADEFDSLRGLARGRGIIAALTVTTLQQASYTTDSILLMETVASTVSSQNLNVSFLIIVTYNPDTQNFDRASLISIDTVLDYQAGRITREQLLNAVRTVDDNALPQV